MQLTTGHNHHRNSKSSRQTIVTYTMINNAKLKFSMTRMLKRFAQYSWNKTTNKDIADSITCTMITDRKLQKAVSKVTKN